MELNSAEIGQATDATQLAVGMGPFSFGGQCSHRFAALFALGELEVDTRPKFEAGPTMSPTNTLRHECVDVTLE